MLDPGRGRPNRCTARIAFVRGLDLDLRRVEVHRLGSTSTSTGAARRARRRSRSPGNVVRGTMISSPGLVTEREHREVDSAAVPRYRERRVLDLGHAARD
jgi:hypothetical protein